MRNVSARDINLNFNSNGERLTAQVRRAVAQAREVAERSPISVNIDLKREKLLNQLTAFTNKHTKINESSYWLGEAERLRTVISSVTNRDELRNATDQLQVFTSGVRATGYAAVSTTDRIKGMLGNIIKVGNYFGLAFVAVNKFRQSLNTLKTNDTILTEISKTSEMTKQQLKELGDEAFKVASKYGQVSGNYLTAVQEMARSGYEMLSKELAELSLLAQSAGDMTADSANNYLLATDAAYKYSGSVEKLNAALDGANYISNKNSANLTDIADATRVSASFAANAGVAIDELTAAEATMIAVTKRSGSEIGRAFRSIVLNLQQVSGEFDGEVIDEEQLKKVEKTCHDLGVELEYMKDGVPTLRNTMDVLRDLAEVYNSLPDNSAEKQGLISSLGGKYHANSLSALLSRWDLYEKMLSEFSQGTGSALEEAEKTADSWEGRIAKLQNSWDSFINTLTNKEAIKGGISFFDRLIQGATELTNAIGEIPVVLTALNSALVMTNKDYGITQIWNKDKGKIDLQGNIFGIDITNIKNMKKHFAEAEGAIAGWNRKLMQGQTDINKFGEAIVKNNVQFKEYLSTCSKDAPASLEGYKAHLKAAGVSTDALRLKTVLLNAAISMGVGIALQLAMKGIILLAEKMSDLAHESEKCKERVDELMSNYQSALDKANSNAKTVEELASKYEELSKGVNSLGENIGLTTDEYTEYNKIANQIADMFPAMIQGYTDEGTAILSLKGNVEQLRDAYKEAQQEAYNTLIVTGEDSSGNDIIKNYQNHVNSKMNFAGVRSESSAKDIVDILTKLTGALTPDEFRQAYSELAKEYENIWGTDKKIQDALRLSGINDIMLLTNYMQITPDDLSNVRKSARIIIKTYQTEIEASLKSVRLLANAFLMTSEDYEKLDDRSKNIASVLVNSINESIADGFSNLIDVGEYVDNIVNSIKDNPEVQQNIENLFALGDVSKLNANEAVDKINQYINAIAEILKKDPLELKVMFGFEQPEDIKKKFENSLRQITDDEGYAARFMYNREYDELLDFTKDFTVEQQEFWLEATRGAENAAQAIEMWNAKLAEMKEDPFSLSDFFSLESAESTLTTLGKISESINTIQNAYKTLSDAIDEYNEEGAFSIDTLQSVIALGDDWLDYLVNKEGKLKLTVVPAS